VHVSNRSHIVFLLYFDEFCSPPRCHVVCNTRLMTVSISLTYLFPSLFLSLRHLSIWDVTCPLLREGLRLPVVLRAHVKMPVLLPLVCMFDIGCHMGNSTSNWDFSEDISLLFNIIGILMNNLYFIFCLY